MKEFKTAVLVLLKYIFCLNFQEKQKSNLAFVIQLIMCLRHLNSLKQKHLWIYGFAQLVVWGSFSFNGLNQFHFAHYRNAHQHQPCVCWETLSLKIKHKTETWLLPMQHIVPFQPTSHAPVLFQHHCHGKYSKLQQEQIATARACICLCTCFMSSNITPRCKQLSRVRCAV